MTIKECIDIVDNNKPNQYTVTDKVMWLSFLDEIIINDVLKTHEGYDGRYDLFEGYSEDKLSTTLIVPSPYDKLYPEYLKMKIDGENGETAKYNNSMRIYDSYLMEFRKYYNKTHMPLDIRNKRPMMPIKKATSGLSEAEYENLKRDLTFILTNHFSDIISHDKLYDVVWEYVQNNRELFNGKPGTTPIKGIDYYTDADKAELLAVMQAYIAEMLGKYTPNNTNAPTRSYINILGGISNWEAEDVTDGAGNVIGSRYGQIVNVNEAVITPNSKVDLQLSSEQIVVFHEKSLAFVAENDDGVITIYCVGTVPENNYKIQAIVTEVGIDD